MCPFCVMTTAAIVSGSISAGGLGTFLIGKAWARDSAGQVPTGAEASHLPEASMGEAAQPETPESPRNR
jgi:hypothetical protein